MTPQFKAAVETYGRRFMTDLGLAPHHVAGIFGNFAVESGQFKELQERNPTVTGSRGGWGWAQWTGPRRRAFEAWADGQALRRDDPEGFYRYVLVELRGPEKAALACLRRTATVESAAESFMRRYERPGVEHLDRRKAFAREALALLGGSPKSAPAKPTPARASASPAPAVVATVPAPVAPATAWWRRVLRLPAATTPVERPGLAANGDPALWDVQDALFRLRYPVGLRDGLMGRNTRNAIREARAVNGLPPGDELDAAFRAALPGMRRAEVSALRADAGTHELARQAPEATKQLAGLGNAGWFTVAASALGGAQQSGILDSVKGAADQATATLQTVQTVVNTVVGVIQWCVDHWWVLGLCLGAYILARVGMAILRLVVLLRQGRLL